MIGASMAVRPPRSRGPVLMMIDALRRIGGSLWMVDNAFSGSFVDITGTQPVTNIGDLLGLTTDRLGVLGVERRQDFVTGVGGTATAATYNTGTGAGSVTRVDLANQSFVRITGLTATASYRLTLVNTGAVSINVRQLDYAGSAISTIAAGASWSGFFTGHANCVITAGGGTATFTINEFRELTGNHATQSAVASKPSFQRVNGRNVISFDGNNDFLQTGITTGNEGWVCAGVTHNVAATAIVFSGGGENATQAGACLRLVGGGGPQLMVSDGATVQIVQSGVFVAPGTPFVYDGGWTAAIRFVAANGAETQLSKSVNCTSSLQSRIGGSVTGGLPLNGPMTAIIYTPVLPSAADRATIRNGIAALQGRTL